MKTILFFTDNKNTEINLTSNDSCNIIYIFNYDINNILNVYQEHEKKDIYICSDNIQFLIIAYRMYTQIFDAFIYHSSQTNKKLTENEEHKLFLHTDILVEEEITIPIYYLKDEPKDLFIDINLQKIHSIDNISLIKKKPTFEKIFYFNNKYLITTGVSINIKVINLDNSDVKQDINVESDFIHIEPIIVLHINYILNILTSSDVDKGTALNKSQLKISKLPKIEQYKFFIILKLIINTKRNIIYDTFINSFLIDFDSLTDSFFHTIIDEIQTSTLTKSNKYYLFWQYLRLYFITPNIQSISSQLHIAKLYRNVYNEYKDSLNDLTLIPKENRNKNLIFIFTSQFLESNHAPTKLILERASYLIKDFNKDVLIINTKELITQEGAVPFFKNFIANDMQKYSNTNYVSYNDLEIPFYQPFSNMPNEGEINNILSIVKEYKPYFLLNFGSGNLTCDLCSNIISSITFPTTSDFPISESQIRINRTMLSNDNKNLCKELNIDERSLIISNPKNGYHESKVTYSKEDYDLPNDKFLLSIVGNRLDNEVSDEFILMILNTITENTFIVFIGEFLRYSLLCDQFPLLKNNSKFLPYQDYLSDVLKLFDLHINPDRIGGGHGALYSIMHSIPIVTLDKGDVHTLTKNNFSVSSYNEMEQIIKRYIHDPLFYKEQSKIAHNIYEQEQDIKKEISLLIEDIEKNPYFF